MTEVISITMEHELKCEIDKFCGGNRSYFIREAVKAKIKAIKNDKGAEQ